jgi:hypothetical protein
MRCPRRPANGRAGDGAGEALQGEARSSPCRMIGRESGEVMTRARNESGRHVDKTVQAMTDVC